VYVDTYELFYDNIITNISSITIIVIVLFMLLILVSITIAFRRPQSTRRPSTSERAGPSALPRTLKIYHIV